ncbi:MAG: response regulator transcription factor [Anaerolineae bacterium]|jgi:NarL family two-component system response regulator LiaR|nr:response regulator transcription factor [Anaerolineae bacterium]
MDSADPIRIVIVDDHAMLLKGLGVFLKSYPDLQLVGEAANGKEALVLCAEQRPDIVLMDLMMPIMDGITATRLIHRDFPDIAVIILTSFGEERLIKEALEAGALSYLFKKISADNLAAAIRAAKRGVATYAPEVTEILVQSLHSPKFMFHVLTPREREVLGLMVKGFGNNEIARDLNITVSTTKSHVSSVLSKLGVASRTEAIIMVLAHNVNLGAFYIP